MFSCPTSTPCGLLWYKLGQNKKLDQSLETEKDLVEEDQVSVVIAPDIVLQMEGQLFFVNREHLAQLSHYFRAIFFFFGGGQQNTRKHVEIKDL